MNNNIPIEVSARHIHLCQKHLEILFGKGYKLKKLKQLTQPSDFAAQETLVLKTDSKKFPKVRIVGPPREETQVEISLTDAVFLGINPPVKISGNLKGSSAATLIGPKGKVNLKKGVIIAQRHIHCNLKQAKNLDIKDSDLVSVKVKEKRAITFHNVKIRVDKNYQLCMHIDTDEGNASGITKKGKGTILRN